MIGLVLLAACNDACPAAWDKFDPGMDPDETMVLGDPDPVCSGGRSASEWFSDGAGTLYRVGCKSTWCDDGFVGDYCVLASQLNDWRDARCPGCDIVLYGQEGSFVVASVECSPQE